MSVFGQKNVYKGFPSLIWPKLYDVTYVKASDKLGDYDKPVFSTAAKSLNGKIISLPGYIVPFDNGMESAHFMFSSMPLNACFFCGVGGPESVIEVFLKEEISYTDKPVEIKGLLRLNDKDPDKMMYILDNAELVGEVGF
jgi:hypothetical protein